MLYNADPLPGALSLWPEGGGGFPQLNMGFGFGKSLSFMAAGLAVENHWHRAEHQQINLSRTWRGLYASDCLRDRSAVGWHVLQRPGCSAISALAQCATSLGTRQGV